jgi:hypothetical protein
MEVEIPTMAVDEFLKEMDKNVQERPIWVVDRVSNYAQSNVDLLNENKQRKLRVKLFVAIAEVIKSEGVKFTDSSEDYIFGRQITEKNKKIASFLILNSIYKADWLTKNVDLSIKIQRLFDEAFESDMYKKLGINNKHQSYEKLPILLEGFKSQVDDLSRHIEGIVTVESFIAIRQSLMRNLSASTVKPILTLTTPLNSSDNQISYIYTLLDNYVNSIVGNFELNYRKLVSGLSEFRDICLAFDTIYSVNIFANIATRVLAAIKIDYDGSEFNKSPKIEYSLLSRKFPLRYMGAESEFDIQIHNSGNGYANDFRVTIDEATEIEVSDTERYIGELSPGDGIVLSFKFKVISSSSEAMIILGLHWMEKGEKFNSANEVYSLSAQTDQIDWEILEFEEPYSTEPVDTEIEFIGRSNLLKPLLAATRTKSLGSAYIYGQKRVGKTSIVKTLKRIIETDKNLTTSVIYLDSGYANQSPQITIENLVRRLYTEICRKDTRLDDIKLPKLDGSLAPLSEFLHEVYIIAPDLRILIILDEFDELPHDLYKSGDLGNTFFVAMRSIAAVEPYAFILVGGERMQAIFNFQGERLNKFKPIRVDYFDRNTNWEDFSELVRKPISGILEIDDDALNYLYEQTAGNPFFTKVICQEAFKQAIDRHDNYIGKREMIQAVKNALLLSLGSNSFAHFWTDGILGAGAKQEEILLGRRKVLLALADVLRTPGAIASKAELIRMTIDSMFSTGDIERILEEFEARHILSVEDGQYRCRVKLFEEWLREKGPNEIITGLANAEEIISGRRHEEEARVKSEELVRLVDSWGLYQGKQLTEDYLRRYLTQFQDVYHQRVVFEILKRIKFYTATTIRKKLEEADKYVLDNSPGLKINVKQRKKSEILISHLDIVGKSGIQYARMYSQVASIKAENVSSFQEIAQKIEKNTDVQVLVFIDDFVGTGNSALNGIKELEKIHGDTLRERKIMIHFVAVTGFDAALQNLETELATIDLNIKIYICDLIGDEERCFSKKNTIFSNEQAREQAKSMLLDYSTKLWSKFPLGYNDGQCLVVFEYNCPNNSLPILWSTEKDWIPLFKR